MGHTANNQSHPTGAGPNGNWSKGVRSIQFKASAMVLMLVLVITGFGMTLSLHLTSEVMYDKAFARTRDWAEFLAASNAKDVAAGNHQKLAETANHLVHSQRGVYMAFADSAGQLIASAEAYPGVIRQLSSQDGKHLLLQPLDTPQLLRYPERGLFCVDMVMPIPADTIAPPGSKGKHAVRKNIGYLRFALNVSDTYDRLQQMAARYVYAAILVVLAVVPCSLLMTRRVIAPVKELARTAHAIADGAMDARARVYANDEIGELAEWFNRMATRVNESQLELLQLNAELEQRVQQRTQELEELAARDPLTGLYNRRYFGEVMSREFAAAERYDDDLTCLMFDIDHFKMINDRFGHRTGDDILIALAGAIGGELRGSDVAARFGGDEFILLLSQTTAASARSLADRIVRMFAQRVAQKCPGLTPTVSIGVASLKTTRAPSSEGLTHEADVALYAAKESGRNRTIEAPAAVG